MNLTKTSLKWGFLSLAAATAMSLTSCSDDNTATRTESSAAVNVPVHTISRGSQPKYIIYLIGDGMASPQINLAEAALGQGSVKRLYSQTKSETPAIEALRLRELPVVGMATTHAEDRYITGSAAAATALATGNKTLIGYISQDYRLNNMKTMAEYAKEKGMSVGIVSSVSIDHATPACFYAHTDDRNKYEEIGNQLLTSGFDYFAGGSVRWNKRKTLKSATEFAAAAQEQGFKYVDTKADFDALNAESGRVIATLNKLGTGAFTSDGSALPYSIDGYRQDAENQITLKDFTVKGMELMENDPEGFFLMVESGKIDWACHANDATTSAFDMIAFDEVVGAALDFYDQHPDETLIVVTGDHDTGGLTLGFASTSYETTFQNLENQTMSYVEFTTMVRSWDKATMTFGEAMTAAGEAFGLGTAITLSDYEINQLEAAFLRSMGGEQVLNDVEEKLHYGGYDPFTMTCTHILNNKSGIAFSSYKHTAVPVPVFAIGAGSSIFTGYYDNTDVAKKIMEVADLK